MTQLQETQEQQHPADSQVGERLWNALFTARDAQHALDKALVDCEAEAACSQTFPQMASRIRNLITSLDRKPRHVRIVHPRTGIAEEIDVDARLVSSVIFSALYSPLTASIVLTSV